MTVSGKDKRGLVEELRTLRTRLDRLEHQNAELVQVEQELRESLEQFRTIFDDSPVGLYRTTPDGRILMANSAVVKMLGYSSFDELARRNLENEGYDPQYPRSVFKERIEREGKVIGQESAWKRSDGTTLYVRESAQAVRDESGKTLYYQGTVEDITERRQTKNALRASEETFGALVRNLSEGVDIVDENLRSLFANPAGEEIFGVEPGGLVGRSLHEFISDESHALVEEQRSKRCKGIGGSYDLEIIRPDGQKRQLIVTGTPRFSEDGKYTGALAVFFDVTEKKQAEEALRKAHDELEMRVQERTAELQQANEALRESENRYRTVIENAGEGIVVVQDGMLRFVNSRHTSVTGRSREESTSRPFIEFVHPDDRERVAEIHAARLRGEQVPPVYELRVIDKEGRTKWLENNGVLIEWDGRPASLNFLRDITARKNAEEEKSRLLKALQTTKEAVSITSPEGFLVFVNDATENLFGYEKGELIGKHVSILTSGPGAESLVRESLDALRKVGYWEGEAVNKKKDGTEFITYATTSVVKDEKDTIVNLIRTQNDITEHKRAEQALRESEGHYHSLAELSPVGIFRTNAEGDRTYVNERWTEIAGIRPEESFGKGWAKAIHPDDRERVLNEWYQGVREQRPFHLEYRFRRPDGAVTWVQGRATAEKDIDGHIIGYVGTISDITDLKRAERALREREATLTSVFRAAPVGIGLERDRVLSRVNDTICEMLGYSTDELVGRHARMFYPSEEEYQCTRGEKRRQILERGTATVETQWKRKDGRIIDVLLSTTVLDPADFSKGVTFAALDITERKRAEEVVRESEEKFRSLAEQSPNMIFINKKGRVVYANKKCEEIMGYTREELYSPDFDFRTLVAPESADVIKENYARHLRGQEVEPYDYCLINKQGERIEAINASKLIQYEGQTAILGIVTNITERKRVERELRESQERLQILFESAPDAIYVTDLEGRFVDGNRAAEELVGFTKAELIGKSLAESGLLPAEDMSKAAANLRKVAAGKPSGPTEYTVRRKNGSLIAIEVRTFPVTIGGRILSLGIARDVTERKRAQQKLLDDREQLKSLASQLSLTEERERHRLATELHDHIGQSLVISKIKLDQLQRSESAGELAEALKDVSLCLGQVIHDTRTLTFDLSYPILYELGFEAAVAEWLTEEIQEKHGIETEFQDDGQAKPLDDDIRALLFRNVRELLINVVKHAQAHHVKVSVRKADKHICVSVEDDGFGFDPVEAAAMAGKRAELGLFGVRERLEQLGGCIEIESEPGRGTKITMTAPLKYEQVNDGT